MFRYSAFILFLFCFYSGLAAADKTDDDALLLQLDKMIEQRELYQDLASSRDFFLVDKSASKGACF